MIKFLFIFLSLFLFSSEGSARAVKLGSKTNQRSSLVVPGQTGAVSVGISCFDNDDCSYDKECVALQCVDVCKNASCLSGTYCAPAGEDKPHQYQCAQCVVNSHCPEGMFCDRDYTCKYPDPCADAVCPPAAPFCQPKPYKTLPYTCVQCTQDDHCPPVAGLTRKCVDGYCLFNIEGNIPASAQPAQGQAAQSQPGNTQPSPAEQQTDQQPLPEDAGLDETDFYDEDLYPYEDEYEDMYY